MMTKQTSTRTAKVTELNQAADSLGAFLDAIGHDWTKGNGTLKAVK